MFTIKEYKGRFPKEQAFICPDCKTEVTFYTMIPGYCMICKRPLSHLYLAITKSIYVRMKYHTEGFD